MCLWQCFYLSPDILVHPKYLKNWNTVCCWCIYSRVALPFINIIRFPLLSDAYQTGPSNVKEDSGFDVVITSDTTTQNALFFGRIEAVSTSKS